MAANTPRLTSIKAQIESLLASGKTAKISAGDYRTVATSTINYIDNKVLTAGSQMISGWADRDSVRGIYFAAPITTPYFVVGSISTPLGSEYPCRTFITYQSLGPYGFNLLGVSLGPVAIGNVLFEYIIFAYEEQQ